MHAKWFLRPAFSTDQKGRFHFAIVKEQNNKNLWWVSLPHLKGNTVHRITNISLAHLHHHAKPYLLEGNAKMK